MLTMTDPNSKTLPEKLLPKEIRDISQKISQNYAPVAPANTPISRKEMREISQEITRKYPLSLSSHKHNLILLPIDPSHLHACWHLQQNTPQKAEKNSLTDKIVLRIYPHTEQSHAPTPTTPWFDIEINNSETRQTINLPVGINADYYSAAIGRQGKKNDLAIFATSKVVHMPLNRYISSLCANSAHHKKDAV